MNEQKVKVAVIACGNRSRAVVNNLLRDSNRQVEIVSVYDPDASEMEFVCQRWNTPDALRCHSGTEAINAPGVEWVMIFAPNVYHKQYILEAFAAGKHVFSEKPIATTIEDAQEIYNAWRQTNLLFATGFVLRYGDIYRTLKSLLDSGRFRRILSVEANENIRPAHGGYIMRNWRRQSAIAGPHILEKCCHDLDLLIWMCGSLPKTVAAFGGKEFFRADNRCIEEKYGAKLFTTWRDPHAIETPFNDDSDLMDTLVSITELRNGVRVAFNYTMSNTIPERRMLFHCSEGVIDLELYSLTIRCRQLGEEPVSVYRFDGDGHAGGDDHIMRELFETMTTGKVPACSGSEGLESAVFALAIDQAARTRQLVDVEPIWRRLER